MNIAAVASVTGAAITAVSAYFGIKSHKLPSKSDVRREIKERLDGEHEIPTPLAARREEEIEWAGDFHITVENVDVYEQKSRRKWLPGNGFEGKTILEFRFQGREVPSEDELYKSFLGRNSHYEQMNKHVDDPYRLDIRFDVADPDVICDRLISVLRHEILKIKFKKDNPDVDEDWLLHLSNTTLGYKDGNIYDILNEQVALPLVHLADTETPDNIPRKVPETEEEKN